MKNRLTTLMVTASIAMFTPRTMPLREWNTTIQTPYVLYISGDGGLNNFSINLCGAVNKAGYGVTAVNAEAYFQDRKTPAQTTNDVVEYLEKIFKKRENQQLVLAGYSFGADVIPFIVNRLPDAVKEKLTGVILISPSTSTDFEIHWLDMVGWDKKRSMDVVAEINAMHVPQTTTIFGSDEKDFPVKDIKLKNYRNESLSGGHHFDDNTDKLAEVMLKYL